MLSLVTNSYASKFNQQYNNSASHIISLRDRWITSTANLASYQKAALQNMLTQFIAEFKRSNPQYKTFAELPLAEAIMVKADKVFIDTTMQRLLDLNWVLSILRNFKAVRVVPIQVYRDESGRLIAWDGQHTAIMLWLVITQIFAERPEDCEIPVVIYRSSLKNEMRENFISLNSGEAKKSLESIDLWMQQIFGVRIDGSTNPSWVEAELKQQHIENNDLFVTANKFNNTSEYGAISRLQEINKLKPETVEWLAYHLQLSTRSNRAVEEKEILMMAKYFDLCRVSKVPVDHAYITELFTVMDSLFDCDFEPSSRFWAKAHDAYINWHANAGLSQFTNPRFNKEPIHGMPFLIAQLKKSFSQTVPAFNSTSEFVPATSDLF